MRKKRFKITPDAFNRCRCDLLEVQEQERRRLSRELHDEVGQSLTGLRLTLERGERLGEAGLREAVGEARALLRDLTGQVRDLSLNLRPSMLDDFGLLPALLWLFSATRPRPA